MGTRSISVVKNSEQPILWQLRWKRAVSIILLSGIFCSVLGTRDILAAAKQPTINQSNENLSSGSIRKEPAAEAVPDSLKTEAISLEARCIAGLYKLPASAANQDLKRVCAQVKLMPACHSVNQAPIFHFEKLGRLGAKSSRILTLSVIHGDEPESGSVSREWMQRLLDIEPRNTWRVIPIANPDGLIRKTRMNARGVDVNRNFPSKDWNELALKYWESKQNKEPRRYPGPSAASEPETRCLIDQIEEFKPDFIISIHTPLGVLDFDGPKNLKFPRFDPLPWISLGNFPGSLGRYMWIDRKVPVLTIELKANAKSLERLDDLQDVSGTVALQAEKILATEKKQQTARSVE